MTAGPPPISDVATGAARPKAIQVSYSPLTAGLWTYERPLLLVSRQALMSGMSDRELQSVFTQRH